MPHNDNKNDDTGRDTVQQGRILFGRALFVVQQMFKVRAFFFQFSTSFFSAFFYLYFGYLTRAMRVVYWLQEVLSCFGFCPPQLRNRGRSQGRRKV